MVVDDLAEASRTEPGMQESLHIAKQYPSRERYCYNVNKTKTVLINAKTSPNFLNNKPVGTLKNSTTNLDPKKTSSRLSLTALC